MMNRKKAIILYICSIPFIAALYVYYAIDPGVAGTSSLIIASIILFLLVYKNLQLYLEYAKKSGK